MGNPQRLTISACMIVKNEEELLPNCLNSIKNAVDEIVIVDTGSTDNTVTIAKDFGARVYYHPWNDSFSEARNHSLSYATGDWILQIDADEELEQSDIPKLRHAINNDRYNGIIVAILNILKENTHTFYYERVFRRGKAFYKGIVHNQIVIEGDRLPTEIRLYHHGYNLDEKKMQMKWQRTTDLLKKQILQNNRDSFAWFNLIRSYRTQGLFQEGIDAGEESLKIISPHINTQHYAMIVYETANCYLHKDDFEKVKALCYTTLSKLAELKITPENIDIIFTLACSYLKEGDYNKAVNYFQRFLSLREIHFNDMKTKNLLIDTLGYDYAAYNGIGYCLGKVGQWDTALNYLQKSLASNPKYLLTYKNLAQCYVSMGNHTEAINTLLKTCSEGIADDGVLLELGELYIKEESHEKAIPCFEDYSKLHPENKNVLLKIARCYEKLGYLEAALVGYKSALGEKFGDQHLVINNK